MKGRSQFVGAAGQHYVAYCLSVRGIHAAITLGNVPDVDIIAAEASGAGVLSIQVKTSRSAYRSSRYGKEVCEWDVGTSAVGRYSESLWYALVDLQEEEGGQMSWKPRVFLVPSILVARFVQPEWSRKVYMLPFEAWSESLERWDKISSYLARDADTLSWCNCVPPAAADW